VAVANTCQWLDFTCAKGEGGFGDDTDAAGSSVIARWRTPAGEAA